MDLTADAPDMSQMVLPDMADVVVSQEHPLTAFPCTSNRGITLQVFDTVLSEVFRRHVTVYELLASYTIRRCAKADVVRTISVLIWCGPLLRLIGHRDGIG